MQTKSEIILAKICNNPLGRKFLGVPKNKRIYKITKYSAHFYTGESSKEGLPIISTGECVSNRKMKLFNWLETWKPIHLCWLFRRLNLKIPNYFIGADTGELAPGTTGNDTSVGTKEWYLTDNVKFEGGSPCLNTLGDSDLYSIKENSIKLVVGDAIVGDEKATDTYLPEESLTAVSYGGSAVLWGLSLTDTQVNASNFGFVYSVKTTAGTIETSYYLKVTNFNCSVPSGAIINGVTVKVVCCQHSYTPVYPQIDYVTLTVHYTGLSTSSTSISALSNLKSVCSSLILGKAQLVSTTIQTLLAKGNLGLPNLLSAKARIQNTKTKAITTKANIKETGVLTNISAKAQLIVMSYTTLSAKSNIIERERVENKLCYKLYEPDGTFIKVLSPDEIISNLTISRTINGGVGGVTISLKKPIDNYDEYDAVKNPTGAIKYGNRLKIFLTDRFNTDKQIFYGYLVAIGPQYTNGQETVVLTFYGAVSKLSNDYYNISGTPPYEPTEPAGFYVEETAESSSKIIKNILDNFILQTTNPMVSYIWGTTIDDCGNSVSYTFDRMKHLDTLKKIEEYLPTTWYWYVDGEGDLYVKDSSSQTEHTLVIGRDIAEIKSHKTIESVVNYFVFWNGRSTADASYVFIMIKIVIHKMITAELLYFSKTLLYYQVQFQILE